jgi:arylsulfatase A-like enzyme
VKRFALGCLVSVLPLLSCTCRRSEASSQPSAAASTARQDTGPAAANPVLLDVVRDLDACALGHRGVLLDFGDRAARANLHPGSLSPSDDDVVEHEGATWLRTRSRTVSAAFYWPEVASDSPSAGAYAQARIRSVTARGVTIAIDGKVVGTWALTKGDARIVDARASMPVTLAPGGHELTLRFVRGPHASGEPLAEIDWVHIGTGEEGEPYSAPTRLDAVVEATLGGRSMRALSMRAPGFARCSGFIPSNATLESSLATAGGSDADVEALLLRDRHAPVVLGTAHVSAAATGWAPWSVPVAGLEGRGGLASVELVVVRAGKGTRVLLGEPRIVAAEPRPVAAPPTMRGVVLVVLGSTSSKALAPWGGARAVPALAGLAAEGATFVANRASSSLANAVLASMLTGLSPRRHGLDDPDARLPDSPTTVQEACRQGGVATAMFTANPTTGAAFGLARGWDTFVAHDPLESDPATQVFDEAAAWIDAHKGVRFFIVVHARGGHPPWDATPEELKSMPPEGYLGMVEPRRAAEVLTKARKHPARFKEDDRVRAWALYDRAIDAHDAALGRVLGALHNAGREQDTTVIVTGDVAATEGPVPFSDPDTVDEPLLATPLAVRWPGDAVMAARHVDAPTSPLDIARTVLRALGLEPPVAFGGVDLAAVAEGALVPAERPLVATRAGRFSVRWGPYVLMGVLNREARMCDLSLDPACVADVRATSPLALEAVHRWAVDALASVSPPPFTRTPAILDAHALAALVRWGRPSDERDEERAP